MPDPRPAPSDPAGLENRPARESRVWRALLWFFVDKAPTPLMRVLRRAQPGSPFEEFVFVGRRTGKERRLLLALYEIDGAWYVGHPNGTSHWIRNMQAAGGCTVVRRDGSAVRIAASEVEDPALRERILAATGTAPAPAGLIFRAARSHIRAVGRYFLMNPDQASS